MGIREDILARLEREKIVAGDIARLKRERDGIEQAVKDLFDKADLEKEISLTGDPYLDHALRSSRNFCMHSLKHYFDFDEVREGYSRMLAQKKIIENARGRFVFDESSVESDECCSYYCPMVHMGDLIDPKIVATAGGRNFILEGTNGKSVNETSVDTFSQLDITSWMAGGFYLARSNTYGIYFGENIAEWRTSIVDKINSGVARINNGKLKNYLSTVDELLSEATLR